MYIKLIDGKAASYSRRQLQADNPNVSFPQNINEDTLAEYGAYIYTVDPKPAGDVIVYAGFEQRNGKWFKTWSARDYTDAEKRSQMVVTARQARLALAAAGKLSSVADAIAAIAEPDKTLVSIEWEYATTVERTSPWIDALRPALGLTEEELDALFVQAAEL
jgi:hypothetical protein